MLYAVLGPEGTFSEEAAKLYWGAEAQLTFIPSIPRIFTCLEQGAVEAAMVPLENSTAGIINASMEGIEQFEICIRGEIVIPIRHCLIASQKFALDQLELLISQAAALAQCTDFVSQHLSGIRTEITDSTSKAVRIAAEEKRPTAAIGHKQAAQHWGLKIIEDEIQNDYNYTRFVHIQKPGLDDDSGDKISMVFALADRPGALYEVLGLFSRYRLNLSKIESRPTHNTSRWGYRFYIEVEKPATSVDMAVLLQELKAYCYYVKYLGTYKASTSS